MNRQKEDTMGQEAAPEKLLIAFRVLVEHAKGHGMFVARCLETGSVATSDVGQTAKEMMVELLMDEAAYAVQHNNLKNLFCTPAPLEKWFGYFSSEVPPERLAASLNIAPWGPFVIEVQTKVMARPAGDSGVIE